MTALNMLHSMLGRLDRGDQTSFANPKRVSRTSSEHTRYFNFIDCKIAKSDPLLDFQMVP